MDYRILAKAIGKTLVTIIICVVVVAVAAGAGCLLVEYPHVMIPSVIIIVSIVALYTSIRANYRELKRKQNEF